MKEKLFEGISKSDPESPLRQSVTGSLKATVLSTPLPFLQCIWRFGKLLYWKEKNNNKKKPTCIHASSTLGWAPWQRHETYALQILEYQFNSVVFFEYSITKQPGGWKESGLLSCKSELLRPLSLKNTRVCFASSMVLLSQSVKQVDEVGSLS